MIPEPGGDRLRAAGERLEHLLDEFGSSDPTAGERAEEVVALVTELHHVGLARLVELVGGVDAGLLERLAADPVVGGLLVLHDLHPNELAARVEQALEGVRPYLASHGGDVEVVEVDAGRAAVHLRLLGSCDGCPSSAVTLRHLVEQAVAEAAPEISVLEVEGGAPDPRPPQEVGALSVPVQLSTRGSGGRPVEAG